MVAITHPDYVRHVLVDNHENYDKNSFIYRAVAPILRGGLIGNFGGESWRRQRRLATPSFHRPRVMDFSANMTDEINAMLSRWDRDFDDQDTVDVTRELGYVAMRVVTRTLFGADIGDSSERIEAEFLAANEIIGRFLRLPFPPLSWPTPARRRLRALIKSMDGFIVDLIEKRRNQAGERRDLVTILASAVDEDGTGMTAEQLHSEVLNIIIGGYETTTNTASWLLYLLAKHPDVQQRLYEEVRNAIGDREPTFADLANTPYARMIIDETLRLYTPAWQTMRHTIGEDAIGGYRIPADTDMYINMYVLHRHPEFWPQPEIFDPERFSPEQLNTRPKHAYVPFGNGPRNCLGKHFALVELHLLLIMMVQRYQMMLPGGAPPAEMVPLVTLHPKNGIQVQVTQR